MWIYGSLPTGRFIPANFCLIKPVLEPDVCASRLQSRCVSDYRARCGRLLSQTTGWQVRGWGPARIPSRAHVRVRRPGHGEPGCGAARSGVPQPARDQAVSTSGPRGPEAREVSKAFLEEETSHSSPARRDCWSAVVGRGYRKRGRGRERQRHRESHTERCRGQLVQRPPHVRTRQLEMPSGNYVLMPKFSSCVGKF